MGAVGVTSMSFAWTRVGNKILSVVYLKPTSLFLVQELGYREGCSITSCPSQNSMHNQKNAKVNFKIELNP